MGAFEGGREVRRLISAQRVRYLRLEREKLGGPGPLERALQIASIKQGYKLAVDEKSMAGIERGSGGKVGAV